MLPVLVLLDRRNETDMIRDSKWIMYFPGYWYRDRDGQRFEAHRSRRSYSGKLCWSLYSDGKLIGRFHMLRDIKAMY